MLRNIIYLMFFLSGFCSLLYQIIWIRLAYASFGITTPILSTIISIFMMGIFIGSYSGGAIVKKLKSITKKSSIFFYSVIEILIGIGSFLVPILFIYFEKNYLSFANLNSYKYFLLATLFIIISILPFCIFMGFTIPFAMEYVKTKENDKKIFSYLYSANVIGSIFGTFITSFLLIELFGFKSTLNIAMFLNFLIAILGFYINVKYKEINSIESSDSKELKADTVENGLFKRENLHTYLILFLTGFTFMSLEVVWTRAFIPVLKTDIYSFASLLTIILLSTWIGTYFYRKHLKNNCVIDKTILFSIIIITVYLPVVLNDPRLQVGIITVLFSIFPFSMALGYLTPLLIDDFSNGDSSLGGKAYAVNVFGCILGPLFTSYLLLPNFSTKNTMLILTIPLIIFFISHLKIIGKKRTNFSFVLFIVLFMLLRALFVNTGFEDSYEIYGYEDIIDDATRSKIFNVKRDYSGTVIAAGLGKDKKLLINGIGMTSITPITKIMAHLPVMFHKEKPKDSLVICFGMGTTYRSLLSWDLNTTAVELVPSVVEFFRFFFRDAKKVLKNPKGKIIVDDGRKFLNKTNKKFDIITIDPPPPIQAAGSSLLYSTDFYSIISEHLNKNGVLHHWFPAGSEKTLNAVVRSLYSSFKYLKVYRSIEGWGYHFIASNDELKVININEILKTFPKKAKNDILEWFSDKDLPWLINKIFSKEIKVETLLNDDKSIIISDDTPYNEYFLLREDKAINN